MVGRNPDEPRSLVDAGLDGSAAVSRFLVKRISGETHSGEPIFANFFRKLFGTA
jgi:hypothetical protein